MLTEQRFDIILKLLEERKECYSNRTERTSGCIRVHSAQRHHCTGQSRKTYQGFRRRSSIKS